MSTVPCSMQMFISEVLTHICLKFTSVFTKRVLVKDRNQTLLPLTFLSLPEPSPTSDFVKQK